MTKLEELQKQVESEVDEYNVIVQDIAKAESEVEKHRVALVEKRGRLAVLLEQKEALEKSAKPKSKPSSGS